VTSLSEDGDVTADHGQPLTSLSEDGDVTADHGQPVTSLSEDGDVTAGSDAFQRLKNVLTSEFSEAVTIEKEIGQL